MNRDKRNVSRPCVQDQQQTAIGRWPTVASVILGAGIAMTSQLLAGTGLGAELRVYVGTYTRGPSEGIYVFRMNLTDGSLRLLGTAGGVVNPSFLALHPKGTFLYAVDEVGDYQNTGRGAVTAFAVDPRTGGLRRLNHQPSMGKGPCHLVVDGSGQSVLVANYGSGGVAALPIASDGRLGPATAFIQHEGSSVNPRRQKGPHAHCICLDAANRFAFSADLGLDKILIYRFQPGAGTLVPNEPNSVSVKPGAGPRHFAFHPSGKFAYVINELDSTVTAFTYDAQRGALNEIQTLSTLPDGFRGDNSGAEIVVHPSGKFVYGSNRGHDSIVVFAVDPDSGQLTCVQHQSTGGKTPRNFNVDPTGTYLLAANQSSDTIVGFRIDATNGRLRATGYRVSVPAPVCVEMVMVP